MFQAAQVMINEYMIQVRQFINSVKQNTNRTPRKGKSLAMVWAED
jgi:hypothetical protein